MASSIDYLMVAAIDFGTTYSGFAFSFRHEFERDPTKVSARTWTATSGSLQSLKTSTCVLFKPDKTFHSFGFEAEDKYFELAEEEEHHGWYFFKRFKMQLYNAKTVHKDFPLESDNGETLPAITVFSECIRYLKDEMFKDCRKQNADIVDDDVKWVLTVPAIWTDPAKSFMRAAAEEAGIPDKRLVIALEPEAAANFVKHLPLQKKKEGALGDSFVSFGPHQKYFVLDAGGGTIDIAVHEVTEDGNVREIIAANGGNWGGTKVDDAFKCFLDDIFGQDVIKEFSTTGKSDFLELFRDFEVKKRTIYEKMDKKITIKIPAKLSETFKILNPSKSIAAKIAAHKYADSIKLMSDKIRIEPNVAISFFEKSVSANVAHVRKLFQKPEVQEVKSVLMVGGYSESPILVDSIKSEARTKRLIVPQEAGLVVLKGAVLFGHDPSLIAERKSKYTYGVGCSDLFDASIHSEEKKFTTNDGEVRCKNLFSKHVEINQSIKVGEIQSREFYGLFDDLGNTPVFHIYASSEPNPFYTTDKSCNKLGTLTIDLQHANIDFGTDELEVNFTFSGTEIEVKAILLRTKEEFKTHVEFCK